MSKLLRDHAEDVGRAIVDGQSVLVLGPGCQRIGYDAKESGAWYELTRRVRVLHDRLTDDADRRFLNGLWRSRLSNPQHADGRHALADQNFDSDALDAVRVEGLALPILTAYIACTKCLGEQVTRGTTPVESWQDVAHRDAGTAERREAAEAMNRAAEMAEALHEFWNSDSEGIAEPRLRKVLSDYGFTGDGRPSGVGDVTSRDYENRLRALMPILKPGAVHAASKYFARNCLEGAGDDFPLTGANVEWLEDLLWHVLGCDSGVAPSQFELAFYVNLRMGVILRPRTFTRPRPGEFRLGIDEPLPGQVVTEEVALRLSSGTNGWRVADADPKWSRIAVHKNLAATLVKYWCDLPAESKPQPGEDAFEGDFQAPPEGSGDFEAPEGFADAEDFEAPEGFADAEDFEDAEDQDDEPDRDEPSEVNGDGPETGAEEAEDSASQETYFRQPVAVVAGFDLMLERELHAVLPWNGVFHLLVPVWLQRSDRLTPPRLAWIFGTCTKRGSLEEDLHGARMSWSWYGQEGEPTQPVLHGPVVIRISGSPLLRLSDDPDGDPSHQTTRSALGLPVRPRGERARDDEHIGLATVFSEYEALTAIMGLGGFAGVPRSAGPLSQRISGALTWAGRSWLFLGDSFPEWIPRLRLLFNAQSSLPTSDAPDPRGRSDNGADGTPTATTFRPSARETVKLAVDRQFDWPEEAMLTALGVETYAGDLEFFGRFTGIHALTRRYQPFLSEVARIARGGLVRDDERPQHHAEAGSAA